MVDTISLDINDVFIEGLVWIKYIGHVERVTWYFNQNPKADQHLLKSQYAGILTADRVKRMKHDKKTRWHSFLSAMMTFN